MKATGAEMPEQDDRPCMYLDGSAAEHFSDMDVGDSADVKVKVEKVSYTTRENEKGKVEKSCTLRVIAIDGDKLKKVDEVDESIEKAQKELKGKK